MPNRVATLIERDDSDVYVSIASLWEMAIKVGNGKWPQAANLVRTFEAELVANHFDLLPIQAEHARAAGLMALPHRDPFDRLLAAQAIAEGLTLVSADGPIATLGADVSW